MLEDPAHYEGWRGRPGPEVRPEVRQGRDLRSQRLPPRAAAVVPLTSPGGHASSVASADGQRANSSATMLLRSSRIAAASVFSVCSREKAVERVGRSSSSPEIVTWRNVL